MVLRKIAGMVLVLSIPLVFTGCNKDDDDSPTDPNTNTTQKIEILSGQTPDNGMLHISKVTAKQKGWVVLHRSIANVPVMTSNIGKIHVNAGTTTDIMVSIDSAVVNGESLWAVLYTDTGIDGQFEYTGVGSPDQPVVVSSVAVRTPFSVQQTNPVVDVEDQTLSNGQVVIKQVDASENGWLVVHASTSADTPGQVIGKTHVNAGSNINVVVDLDASPENTIRDGAKLWAELHYDRGIEDFFEYPGADMPVMFNGEIVMHSFVIMAVNEPNIVAENQTLTDNNAVVALVSAKEVGWVSIYEDSETGDAPDFTKPRGQTRITLGTNVNVKVRTNGLTVPYGTKLWVVLHYDRGVVGTYEYPGADEIVTTGLLGSTKIMDSFIVQ